MATELWLALYYLKSYGFVAYGPSIFSSLLVYFYHSLCDMCLRICICVTNISLPLLFMARIYEGIIKILRAHRGYLCLLKITLSFLQVFTIHSRGLALSYFFVISVSLYAFTLTKRLRSTSVFAHLN